MRFLIRCPSKYVRRPSSSDAMYCSPVSMRETVLAIPGSRLDAPGVAAPAVCHTCRRSAGGSGRTRRRHEGEPMGGRRRRTLALVAIAMLACIVGGAPLASAIPTPEPRIVNGTPVDAAGFDARWPWIVVLQISTTTGNYRCGGSVIAPQVVLSAAHCFAEPALGTVTGVQVGGGSPTATALDFLVPAAEWRTNPAFNPTTFFNDVALLRVANPLPVQPVLIASAGDLPPSRRGEMAGWGRTVPSPPAPFTTQLHEAQGPIRSTAYCNDIWQGPVFDPA